MFEVRIITATHELEAAYRLNYQAFVEEQRWNFEGEGNKSGLRVIESAEGPMLIDDFNEVAQWFGCFVKDRLVGAFRACKPVNGKFEVEHYSEIPDFYKSNPTVEITRLSIDKEYRSTAALVMLFVIGTDILFKSGILYGICTATFPTPGSLYVSMGAEVDTSVKPFKYSPQDPDTVLLCSYPLLQLQSRAAHLYEKAKLHVAKSAQGQIRA